jgi:hypothetical protein
MVIPESVETAVAAESAIARIGSTSNAEAIVSRRTREQAGKAPPGLRRSRTR